MKKYYNFEINNNSFVVILNNDNEIIYINMNDEDFNYSSYQKIDKDNNLVNQFIKYFNGELKDFNIDYKLVGTEFQIKVWEELKKVPYGTKITYSELAKRVDNINKTRAVATAVGNNPIVIAIPCHRIVRKDGTIGQYSAGGSIVKKALLDLEFNNVDIRLATKDDQNKILSLYDEAKKFIKSYNSPQWQNGYPNLESFNLDLNNKQLYVLILNNKIVAVASILDYEITYDNIEGKWLNNDPYLAIHRIVVSNQYKGYGLASLLINSLANHLKASNIKIDTHELNVQMQNMLLKNGFKYCGIITLNNSFDNKRLAYQKIIK